MIFPIVDVCHLNDDNSSFLAIPDSIGTPSSEGPVGAATDMITLSSTSDPIVNFSYVNYEKRRAVCDNSCVGTSFASPIGTATMNSYLIYPGRHSVEAVKIALAYSACVAANTSNPFTGWRIGSVNFPVFGDRQAMTMFDGQINANSITPRVIRSLKGTFAATSSSAAWLGSMGVSDVMTTMGVSDADVLSTITGFSAYSHYWHKYTQESKMVPSLLTWGTGWGVLLSTYISNVDNGLGIHCLAASGIANSRSPSFFHVVNATSEYDMSWTSIFNEMIGGPAVNVTSSVASCDWTYDAEMPSALYMGYTPVWSLSTMASLVTARYPEQISTFRLRRGREVRILQSSAIPSLNAFFVPSPDVSTVAFGVGSYAQTVAQRTTITPSAYTLGVNVGYQRS